MNQFANSLFTLLFGWVRSLVEGLWVNVSSGKFRSFFVWLGDHWLWVAAILCLICTAVDFIIWMIRWRPYLVWRTRLAHFWRRLKGEKPGSGYRKFSEGYEEGVPLDISSLPPEEETNPPAPQPLPEEFWAPEQPAQEEKPRRRGRRFFPAPPAYEPPPIDASPRADSAFPSDMPAARRKRRSEKYDRRRLTWHERLAGSDEDDNGLLDGLPPVINREDAFHEPVYPGKSPYQAGQDGRLPPQDAYRSWQAPPKNSRTDQTK